MTLATHAVVGAALATAMPEHPALAFCVGFASHFAADAIPHWDYPIRSESINPLIATPVRFDRNLLLDSLSIGTDALIGLALSFIFLSTPTSLVAVLAGAVGGILPDPLQFVSTHLRWKPLMALQRFHEWIHTKRRLRQEGRHFIGIASQFAFLAAVIAAAKLL